MRKPIIGAALLGLLTPPGIAFAQSDYPGEWQEGFHAGISRALAKHQVRGCTQIRYKEHTSQSGTFLVECSEEGNEDWTAYRVNVSERAVEGPLER